MLFLLTCTSVFGVRWLRWETAGPWEPTSMWNAWWFSASLMAILLSHELGHYAVARAHGFRLSLPWFLPAPVMVGTLGAVIRLDEPPRTRAGLLEMGAAGPLVGLAVVTVLAVGRLAVGEGSTDGLELGSPLLWKVASLGVTGSVQPVYTGDPVAFAVWLGCLLTAMNLIPIGQLDGGHVVAALVPRWATVVGWAATGGLLVAGLWWPGWAVWAAVVHLMGGRQPLEARRDEGFPRGRPAWVAILTGLAWIAVVVPVPA
ncbi:MAG: site-2 protease family protein [Alphaproteobacteria bacterium]|nr:site-2 protease family protein [Alphaproteobacteria bacterium]